MESNTALHPSKRLKMLKIKSIFFINIIVLHTHTTYTHTHRIL